MIIMELCPDNCCWIGEGHSSIDVIVEKNQILHTIGLTNPKKAKYCSSRECTSKNLHWLDGSQFDLDSTGVDVETDGGMRDMCRYDLNKVGDAYSDSNYASICVRP